MRLELVIRAARVVTPAGERAAAVGIRGGRIAAVEPFDAELPAGREIVLDEQHALLPGLVDTHVHLQEPGHADWEGFDSGTRAAAAGGVTTVVDMPLDSVPVTVTVDGLAAKLAAAVGRGHVDIGFWGGVTPDNIERLAQLHERGVLGFKCFLADTGSPDFPPIGDADLRRALRVLAGFGGRLLVHAEDGAAVALVPAGAGGDYARFLAARPPGIEDAAVATVIAAVRDTGYAAHVVHVSSAGSAALIADARAAGLAVTAETCPHYLTLADTDVPHGGTAYKVCPPIRDAANRDALWAQLAGGGLDMVVSDHSPCAVGDKGAGDFDTAFGGVSSLQVSLPATWTAARRRGFGLADLAGWMSTRPAELAGLPRKGAITVGRDADLCVFAPDETFVVDPGALHHRQPLTPYAGRRLAGVVVQTWLAGRPVDFDHPRGRLLRRGQL